MEYIIEVKDLVRNYEYGKKKSDKPAVRVLKGVNFGAEKKEFTCIMGKSGCGKTTLLRVLGLLDNPTSGTVLFEGTDTKELWVDELADIRRRKIGFVFQDFNLMDSLTVKENIFLPQILDKRPEEEMEQQMRSYVELLQITHLLDKKPYELSIGEKQRTAICRALMNNPGVILADEPTGNLDSKAAAVVMDIFRSINETFGIAIVMITHDVKIAGYSKKTVFLKDGIIYRTLLRDETEQYERTIADIMLEV